MKLIGLANVHVVMLILRIDFSLFETIKTCGRKNVMRYFALLLKFPPSAHIVRHIVRALI